MTIDLDLVNKVAYISLSKTKKIAQTIRVTDDIILDIGPQNEVIGVELLNVRVAHLEPRQSSARDATG